MPVEQGQASIVITGKAIDGYRCKVLRSAIDLRLKGIQTNRQLTVRVLLELAKEYTGQTYKTSMKGLQQASDDLYRLMDGKTLDEIGRH